MPPMIANGIVRRGSLTSDAMIAIRMKPSQLQKKIAAPASTPETPVPMRGVRFSTRTAGAANPTKTPRSASSTNRRMIRILAFNWTPKKLMAATSSTAALATKCVAKGDKPLIICAVYIANASEMTTVETMPLPRYAQPATKPTVRYPNFRDQVNPPPSSGKLIPTDAALNPVASVTSPLKIIASRTPLPALSTVSPRAANRPVPTIIAAVRNIAVDRPKTRRNRSFRSVIARPFGELQLLSRV